MRSLLLLVCGYDKTWLIALLIMIVSSRSIGSLYEERINETEQHRLETEERMHQLEQHAQAAIAAAEAQRDAASSGRGGASTAAEIDNENLREQLSHVRGKFASLEDQLAEANAALEQEQASALRRKERAAEIETNLKKEVKKLKAEVERLSKVEAEHKERADELHDALAESKVALENERAEVSFESFLGVFCDLKPRVVL